MTYCIIPTPYKLTEQPGFFRFRYDTKIVLGTDCAEKEYAYARLLAATIEEKMGFAPAILKGEPLGINEIFLKKTVDTEEMPEDVKVLFRMAPVTDAYQTPNAETERKWKIKTESYSLTVDESRVVISADYSIGMLYGVETLRQLVDQLSMVIPCMSIEDKPAMPNRGFYHDATRGRVEKLSEYKKLADKCAYYKLNQLQLYVEHSYMFRDFSEVWRDDTPLTAEDILELDTYCARLGIELIPSLASFGHLDKVLKTRSFTRLCELPDSDKDIFTFRGRMEHHTINMTDPEAWDFIKKMLEEFIPLFSSRQFNLCGDETFDLGKGRSKALADSIGTHRIYVDFVKKICEYLISKKLRPMFWGDIIVGSPELLSELPRETVCLTWGYSENESDRSAATMDSVGAVQYLCPGVHGWRHLINKYSFAYMNISKMCSYAKKYNALGVLNTDWGDYGHVCHPAFSIPGLIYGAEGSWSSDMPDEKTMNQRISRVEYGDASMELMEVLSLLGDQEAATWDIMVNVYEYLRDSGAPLEEQKNFWQLSWIGGVDEKNKKIAELMDRLSEMACNLPKKTTDILYSFLLHARGQQLLNLTAGFVCKAYFGVDLVTEDVTREKRTTLAGMLEEWFHLYKENFRKTSRESELYRVQEVVLAYADMLRG